MPSLMEEMAADLHANSSQLIREFVVMKRGMSFMNPYPRFFYYTDDHPATQNAVRLLESHGFVVDVTPRNWPVYRMTERFVDLVTAFYPAPL